MTFSVRRSVILGCLVGWFAACSSSKPNDDSAALSASALTSPDGVVSAVLSYSSDWGAGYCASIKVSNQGTSATTSWGVVVQLNQSTVSSGWSGQFATSGDQLTISPTGWNAALAPGASTEVGFCGSGSGRPTIVAVSQTGGSGGGTGGTGPVLTGGTGPVQTGGAPPEQTGGTGPSTGPATISSQSDWGTGFCSNVTISNSGSSASTGWTVVIDLKGAAVNSSWSANFATANGQLTITPLSWNANIPPNGSTSVGFCATSSSTARPAIISATIEGGGGGTGGTGPVQTGGTGPVQTGGAPPDQTGGTAPSTGGTGPATGAATVTTQSDWGAGYCSNVTVSNSGSAPTKTWTVVINLNGSTYNNGWSATLAPGDGQLTATPLSWNAAIPANGSIGFGFCASGSGRPTIASVSLDGGPPTGTGGAASTGGAPPVQTGGTPAQTGGTAPQTGGVAPVTGGVPPVTGGVPPATGGVPPATGGRPPATGGVPPATGGVPPATGGRATGGQPTAVCQQVAALPGQATDCKGRIGESQCDANGNRCVCARDIWYCNNTCKTAYPNPPVPDAACAKGAACTYPNGAACGCVNGHWVCLGTASQCPASPAPGDPCTGMTNLACDYPGGTHQACVCVPDADAGAAPTWTCVVSGTCPATQPVYPTACTSTRICAYGGVNCACMNGGNWICM